MVRFREHEELGNADLNETTELTGWFEINKAEADKPNAIAPTLKYMDMPKHYIWDTSTSTRMTRILNPVVCLKKNFMLHYNLHV